MGDMVHCRGCGAEIHRTAMSCPKCGAQQRTGRVKSKVAAGVLALLLGGLGVHRFYLGQWWGLFYLLLFWTGIPALIALVEGLVFLFSNQQNWDAKYNEGIPSSGSGTAAIVVAIVIVVVVLVPIVGILAAISIPAYHDYTIRAQVTEGLTLAAASKVAVAETYHSQGKVPRDRTAAGLPPDEAGTYVSAVSIENGRVDILYGANANKRIANRVLSLTPYLEEHGENDFEVLWRCGYSAIPSTVTHEIADYSSGNIEAKYLPSACR